MSLTFATSHLFVTYALASPVLLGKNCNNYIGMVGHHFMSVTAKRSHLLKSPARAIKTWSLQGAVLHQMPTMPDWHWNRRNIFNISSLLMHVLPSFMPAWCLQGPLLRQMPSMPDWRWTSKRISATFVFDCSADASVVLCDACIAFARSSAASDTFNTCLALGFGETFAKVVLDLCADASVRPFMPAWCLLGPLLHQVRSMPARLQFS